MMNRKMNRIIGILCVVLLLVCGCGNVGGAGEASGAKGQQAGKGSNSMGRYMETICELPEEINRNGGLNWLDDGSMSIISFGNGLYRSSDGGESWQQEDTTWFPMIQGVYCMSAVMGPDGTVAATCSGEMPKAAKEAWGKTIEDGWEGNYCVFALPDGTVKIVDFGFSSESGDCICSLWFKGDGRLFAGDFNGRIYEVNIEKESLRELFVADRMVGHVDFSGLVLMAVGYDRLYLYDLKQEILLSQDDTVDAFIRQILEDETVSYTSGGYPLAVIGGEENDMIYIACRDGLYRHALGGSVMEQVIDGALSTFGDAYMSIYSMRAMGNHGKGEMQEFTVLFNPSSGLAHYTFDESIASMPEKEIRIYSLEENRSVRQAVTSYKKEHPDMYVRYETGMQEGSGITEEDALKKLNAQVLSGAGPDVLILDGLPVQTWIEKGMLQDISGIVGKLESEDELLLNLVKGFTREDGAIYAMPMCVQVPLLVGDKETVENIQDLESFAREMESLRLSYPQGGLLGIYDAGTLLKLFGMVSSASWTDDGGQINEEKITDFLVLMKRIYEAETSGAVEEEVRKLKEEDEELAQYGVDAEASKMEVCSNVLNISRGYARIACGYADGIQLCLDSVTSAIRVNPDLDYKVFCGQGEPVLLLKSMVGISSRSEMQEEAEAFVLKVFQKETQENLYEGFPVNRAALEEHFAFMEGNSSNGWISMTKTDGTETELELFWPNEEEEQTFLTYIESLEKPVLPGSYLSELVYETGTKVLEGDISAEDGTAEIVKKAAIYLAE